MSHTLQPERTGKIYAQKLCFYLLIYNNTLRNIVTFTLILKVYYK